MGSKEVKKICSSISSGILKWKLASKEGKLVLEGLTEKLYKEDESQKKNDENSPESIDEIQKNCTTLAEILLKMKEILAELETVEDKCVGVSQLCDLSSSFSQSPVKKLSGSPLKKVAGSSQESNISQNSSLIELDSSVVYTNDLLSWCQTLIQCHKNQWRMNEIIVKNICHLSSRDEALFHMSVWTCQPAMNNEYETAFVAVEQTLKSCSST